MSLTLPHLFGKTRLREIVVPFPRRTLRVLAVEDPWNDAQYPRDTAGSEIYWAELWPSAVALAYLLLSERVRLPDSNEPVLEIGCGAGLVSLAAAVANPGLRCIAADRETRGVKLAAENARRNGLDAQIVPTVIDWNAPYARRHPAVLAADCLYHPEACDALAAFIDRALVRESGARAYVADPIRDSAQGFHAAAVNAGFRVERSEADVPFLLARGPVYRFGSLPAGQAYETMKVHLYELIRP